MSIANKNFSNVFKWLITATVMLSAMIEIIDSTIVNVALNDMAGSLNASTDQISWVVTSYVISSAIFMPLTGFMVRILGRRKLLLLNIVGFLIFSILCGNAESLEEIIIFRILQGIFGASLVPLSQYILRDTFSKKEQVKAMAIWGIGIMAAPVIGPTIGGYLIDWMNWRWIFYINLPVCCIALTMTIMFIDESKTEKVKIDWFGLMLMVIAITTLQIFLDQGNKYSWFSSNFIIITFLLFIVSMSYFIIRGFLNPNNILNLRLFRNKDYAISCLLLMIYATSIFGMIVIQPIIMQESMNYTALMSGKIMAPRGIAAAISMMLIPIISKKINLKIIIATGIAVSAYGGFLYAKIPLINDPIDLIFPGIIQGMGMGFFFVPISTIALKSLEKDSLAEGSGIFSFFRNLGVSLGTSIMITTLSRQSQVSWNNIIKNITPENINYQFWTEQQALSIEKSQELTTILGIVKNQSSIIAFNDVSLLSCLLLVISIPLVFLISISKKK